MDEEVREHVDTTFDWRMNCDECFPGRSWIPDCKQCAALRAADVCPLRWSDDKLEAVIDDRIREYGQHATDQRLTDIRALIHELADRGRY